MKKRFIISLFILTLAICFIPNRVNGLPSHVRVALKYENTSLEEVQSFSSSGLDIGIYAEDTFTILVSIEDNSKVKATKDSKYHLQIGDSFETFEEVKDFIGLLIDQAGEEFYMPIFPLYNGQWLACSSFYSEIPVIDENLSDYALDEYRILYNTFSPFEYEIMPIASDQFAMRLEHKNIPILIVSDSDNETALRLAPKETGGQEPPLIRLYDKNITVAGNEFRARYRGVLDLHRQTSKIGDNFVVVNKLGLEEYLYSVLPAEMSPGTTSQDYINLIEALKVQVITARTFAVRYIEAKAYGKYWADIEDTTTTQVYGGYTRVINTNGETRDGEYPNGNAAVDQTRGQVLMYEGKLASSVFYHSNSGGYTELIENVWGGSNHPAYVVSKPDPYTEARIWKGEYTGKSLSSTFSQYVKTTHSVDIGTIKYVNIISRSKAGRVIGCLLEGTNGSYTVTLERNRWMLTLGTSGLMYNYDVADKIKILYQADGSDKFLSQRARNVLEGRFIDDQYGVIGKDDYLYERIKVYNSDQQKITVNGKGTGHGIGMSQNGATAMSKQGFTYLEIIDFYFPGLIVSEKEEINEG